jgi:hypothetical protein
MKNKLKMKGHQKKGQRRITVFLLITILGMILGRRMIMKKILRMEVQIKLTYLKILEQKMHI